MIYFVFDNPDDKYLMNFINNDSYFATIYPENKLKGLINQFKFVKKVLSYAKKEDTLVFWYDFFGIIASLLCKKNKVRKIIVLNILLKDKKSLKNYIARKIYKKALKKPFVRATISTFEYGELLDNIFKMPLPYYILKDPYHYGCYTKNEDKGYIFCGGRNGRDWNSAFEIAKRIPEYSFHFVLPKKEFEFYSKQKFNNVVMKCELSFEEFVTELKNCSFVVMPLNTNAPAGILVFYEAARFGKMIITNNTLTNKGYFSDNRGMLYNTIDECVDITNYFIVNPDEREEYVKNFNNYLINECSEEIYSKKIKNICEEI